MDTKNNVKRAIWHKAMDPGTKKTAKTPKNDEEDNPGGSSLKKCKARRPTKGKQKPSYVAHLSTNLGKKDAAESTRAKHIQMGAKIITKPSYNPGKAAYNPAATEHTTYMAKKATYTKVDLHGFPHKARLF